MRAKGEHDPAARHPLEEEGFRPPPEDFRGEFVLPEFEKPLENGHCEGPAAARFRQRTGHHTRYGGSPAPRGAPGVGGKECDHAAELRRVRLKSDRRHLTTSVAGGPHERQKRRFPGGIDGRQEDR